MRLGEFNLQPLAIVKLAEVVRATGFSWDALEFVTRGFRAIRLRLHGRTGASGSTNAVQLCWGLIQSARQRFGNNAADQLETFGLKRSEDFGKIIFGLVAVGLLKAEESDRLEDFEAILEVRWALLQLAKASSELTDRHNSGHVR